jgi:hypothetical protein
MISKTVQLKRIKKSGQVDCGHHCQVSSSRTRKLNALNLQQTSTERLKPEHVQSHKKVTLEIRIRYSYSRDEILPAPFGARGCKHGPISSVLKRVQLKSISDLD